MRWGRPPRPGRPPVRPAGHLARLRDSQGFTVVEAMVGSLILAVALAGLFTLQSALGELAQRRRRDAEIGAQLVRVAEQSRAMGYSWWSQQVDQAPDQTFADTPYEGYGFSVQRSAARVSDAGMPPGLIRVTLQAVTTAGMVHSRMTFLVAENGW